MSDKGKNNPKKEKKVKKEKNSEKNSEKNIDNMIDLENDYIRPPIDIYSEQLLPSNHAFIFNQEDEELKLILELSRKEFEENQNTIFNKDHIKEECIEMDRLDLERIELERIELERIEMNRIELERIELERIELDRIALERIELERIELDRIDLDRIELERIELERIEAEKISQLKFNRKESLKNFTNRISKLMYVKEDKELKELIDNILDKYFNLEIDTYILSKKDYIDLYKIIYSYYIIPSSKNLKTAISKEENILIRNIFLDK